MPKQYLRMKRSFVERGASEDEAEEKAAKTYIARGKGGTKSSRAKSLQHGKYRRKPKASYPMPEKK